MKKVSIIIPCFNDGKYLPEAVASAQAQTHSSVETVVVDDHSDDGTRDVLTTLKDKGANTNRVPIFAAFHDFLFCKAIAYRGTVVPPDAAVIAVISAIICKLD